MLSSEDDYLMVEKFRDVLIVLFNIGIIKVVPGGLFVLLNM
jgi:hypothetical protein